MTDDQSTVQPSRDDALVTSSDAPVLDAPTLPYQPIDPKNYHPAIGLIGCGGITRAHLEAYKKAGYDVVALCDINEATAIERRDQYYPDADVYTDYQDVLQRDDIEVVDIATHPLVRVKIIEAALKTNKHVLSQKPFVLDLNEGERLCELADKHNVKLAVNQNGRWAPHVAYLRQVVSTGLLGDLMSVDMSVHFDHSWVVGTAFNEIHDLVLYDFAIHWFDMLNCYFVNQQPEMVFASTRIARTQTPIPPLLAHVLVDYPDAQATMSFNATTRSGQHDRTILVGSKATAQSNGPGLQEQTVTIHSSEGIMIPQLEGQWFNDGFHGTMAELLCAIEENRTPYNSAEENLQSLALAFAAIGSAHDGVPKRPGKVRILPEK